MKRYLLTKDLSGSNINGKTCKGKKGDFINLDDEQASVLKRGDYILYIPAAIEMEEDDVIQEVVKADIVKPKKVVDEWKEEKPKTYQRNKNRGK